MFGQDNVCPTFGLVQVFRQFRIGFELAFVLAIRFNTRPERLEILCDLFDDLLCDFSRYSFVIRLFFLGEVFDECESVKCLTISEKRLSLIISRNIEQVFAKKSILIQ